MSPYPIRSLVSAVLLQSVVLVTAFAVEDRITFDLSAPGAAFDHKASGLLGGFDRGVPATSLMQPLKLHAVRLSQSTQLPEEDPFSLHPRASALGVSEIVLVVSDAVKCTNPTFSDIANWRTHWVSQVTDLALRAVGEGKTFTWDIYNEPDKKIGVTATPAVPCGAPASNPTMTMVDYNDWFSVWDDAYNAIRSVIPSARITGPGYSGYDETKLKAFITHCAANNTMPDCINWHFGTIANYEANAATIRNFAASYGYTVEVMIAEAISAGTDRNLDPGLAVALFANAERADISALHAAWTASPVAGLPQLYVPHLSGLLTPDTLLPRGAWWSYKSYGDMSGHLLTADLVASANLDALASFDSSAKQVIALVGTKDKTAYTGGTGKVKFTNVTPGTGLIDANGYTHVKVERIPLSESELTALPLIAEGDFKPSAAGWLEVPFSVSSGKEAVKITLSLPTVAAPSRLSNRVEGESLSATAISGRTVGVLSDSPSSGSAFSKATLGAVNDWVQYAITVPASGHYWLNIGYKADPSRAIVQASIDGNNLGSVIDESTNNFGYPEASVGLCYLTAGSHDLRLTVTGKSATATGYTVSLDYYRLTRIDSIEGESLTLTPSPGDSAGTLGDAIASGGSLVLCNLNAVGDYTDFSVFVPAPGLYSLKSAVKTFSSRGMFQLSVDGIAQGPVVDGYSGTTPAIKVSSHGFVTFSTPGFHPIRLSITGKNPASSGYTIGLDYFSLTPTSLATVTLADQTPLATTGSVTTPAYFNARGGSYSKVALAGVGATASYDFTVPEDGSYFLTIRHLTNPDGGRFQMAIDGVGIYSEIDTYSYTTGSVETGIGVRTLTEGTHTLTFTATGQAGCSSGYTLGLDAVRASRIESQMKYEAEILPANVSAGSWATASEPGASAGSYVEATIGLGDDLSILFPTVQAGAYRLEVGFRAATDRGRFTTMVNGFTVGRTRTAVYSSTPLMRASDDPNTDFGSFELSAAASPVLSFICQFASPGTNIGIDYISLIKYARDR